MNVFDVLSLTLVGAGAFFLLIGSIGVVRLPDFYARTHATGKSDTLGLVLAILGIAVHEGPSLTDVKLIAIVVFVALTAPVGTHALARSAYRTGLKPWFLGGPVPEDPTSDRGDEDAATGDEEDRP